MSCLKKFIDYMMTDEVQQKVVGKMGYIPINDMKVTRDLKGMCQKIKELGKNERSSKKMLTKSKTPRLEKFGKTITFYV